MYVAQGLASDHSLKIDFYDLELKQMPFWRTDYERLGADIKRPIDMEKLINMAKILSKDTPFMRVDFMEAADKTFFAECTFTPSAGVLSIYPKEYDKFIGDILPLPRKEK